MPRLVRRKPARATWRWSALGFVLAALAVGIGWIALAYADLGGIPTQPSDDHADVVELLSEHRGEIGWVSLPEGYEHLAEDSEVYLFEFDSGQDGILVVTEYGFFDAYRASPIPTTELIRPAMTPPMRSTIRPASTAPSSTHGSAIVGSEWVPRNSAV